MFRHKVCFVILCHLTLALSAAYGQTAIHEVKDINSYGPQEAGDCYEALSPEAKAAIEAFDRSQSEGSASTLEMANELKLKALTKNLSEKDRNDVLAFLAAEKILLRLDFQIIDMFEYVLCQEKYATPNNSSESLSTEKIFEACFRDSTKRQQIKELFVRGDESFYEKWKEVAKAYTPYFTSLRKAGLSFNEKGFVWDKVNFQDLREQGNLNDIMVATGQHEHSEENFLNLQRRVPMLVGDRVVLPLKVDKNRQLGKLESLSFVDYKKKIEDRVNIFYKNLKDYARSSQKENSFEAVFDDAVMEHVFGNTSSLIDSDSSTESSLAWKKLMTSMRELKLLGVSKEYLQNFHGALSEQGQLNEKQVEDLNEQIFWESLDAGLLLVGGAGGKIITRSVRGLQSINRATRWSRFAQKSAKTILQNKSKIKALAKGAAVGSVMVGGTSVYTKVLNSAQDSFHSKEDFQNWTWGCALWKALREEFPGSVSTAVITAPLGLLKMPAKISSLLKKIPYSSQLLKHKESLKMTSKVGTGLVLGTVPTLVEHERSKFRKQLEKEEAESDEPNTIETK